MAHDHHHHDHSHRVSAINTAFLVGIALNGGFVLYEIVMGLRIHSLSLLSDAGHNVADVAGLALSLLAFRLAGVKPNAHYTYGYQKFTLLVALFNSGALVISVLAIGYEAINHLLHPVPLPGYTIAIVAGVGILINSVSALFFLRDKDHDLNIRAAYLHLAADALVSLALVIGGIAIHYTGYYWIDPVLGIAVGVVILVNTWGVVRQSWRLSLDGVPETIEVASIRSKINAIDGVVDVQHVHIWAMSTTKTALTARIIIATHIDHLALRAIKSDIKHLLLHEGIAHVTIETEQEDSGGDGYSCAE